VAVQTEAYVSEARVSDFARDMNSDLPELRRRIAQMVRYRLKRALRRKIDDSDVIQQTLLDIFVSTNKLDGPEFEAWVRQIARNNILDCVRYFCEADCRSIAREVDISSGVFQNAIPGRELTGSAFMSRDEEREKLAMAVMALSIDEQYLLELRHKLGLTFVQIGECLGISEQAARKRWNRIVASLRNDLLVD
jgi:RNA polymerase sigma factor (sigma-70 family)